MARFTPNMSKETAGVPNLSKDDYEFIIRDGKPFERQNAKDETVWGITYILEVASDGQFKGKTIPISLYMHSEKSGSLNKQFLMAAHGYDNNPTAEEAFNNEFANDDGYSIDTDNETMGEYWSSIVGKRIEASASVVPQRDDPNVMQNRFKWRPFVG